MTISCIYRSFKDRLKKQRATRFTSRSYVNQNCRQGYVLHLSLTAVLNFAVLNQCLDLVQHLAEHIERILDRSRFLHIDTDHL